ncbi:hypothetical protein DIURU_003762 [Diutina rugosa]|uniref:Uncharacterized protein n=1 Tax=Diutina rugosa TaxID=5481 RepID=A0A642UJV3_DIURU|nr:uncharacterized protein DIURU_003762 [Diutina rugosa]KAA8900526.1 hypothetical protein DIURU_003762 [Diutina rugosa]
MFRLIQAQAGLRPALLSKVRGQNVPRSGVTLQQGSFRSLNVANLPPVHEPKSTVAPPRSLDPRPDKLDAPRMDWDTKAKLNHFQDCLQEAIVLQDRHNPRAKRSSHDAAKRFEAMQRVIELFLEDGDLRRVLSSRNVFNVVSMMRYLIKGSRDARLSGSKNRDKDQRSRSAYVDEATLSLLTQQITEVINRGECNAVLNPGIVKMLISCLQEMNMDRELFGLWEYNITLQDMAPIYMSQIVLATVLPLGYSSNRFTYEQAWQIFELNKDTPDPGSTPSAFTTDPRLLSSMGQIAVSAGDYSRGLDLFESLLQSYETSSDHQSKSMVLRALCTLHLEFIRSCKDISIASHFFDKVVNNDLPYRPLLKVDCVASLLTNISAQNNLDLLKHVWMKTITYYQSEEAKVHNAQALYSRYSVVNNAFFKAFFAMYPQLNDESSAELRDILSLYQENRKLDEYMVNNVISNYSWNDKRVYDQLVMMYDSFGIDRTQVSYRIALKKLGSIPEASCADIVASWNQSLRQLDADRIKYIPVADWAALRDSTIFAAAPTQERTDLYLALLHAYRNYQQDNSAVKRFIGNWIKSPDYFPLIAGVVDGKVPPVPVEKIALTNLKENVDFNSVANEIIKRKKSKDQSR